MLVLENYEAELVDIVTVIVISLGRSTDYRGREGINMSGYRHERVGVGINGFGRPPSPIEMETGVEEGRTPLCDPSRVGGCTRSGWWGARLGWSDGC